MKKILLVVPMILALSACKIDMASKMNFSDLTSETPKEVSGMITVEVPACNDYRDSRKESKSLTEAKTKIPGVFAGAKFKECYTSNMKSLAVFDTVFHAGKVVDGNITQDVLFYGNENIGLGIAISESFKNKIKKSMDRLSLGVTKLNILVEVNNDSASDLKLIFLSSYVNFGDKKYTPIIYSDLAVKKDSTFTVKLSDTSVDHLIENRATILAIRSQ
ncbi:hypothetical protein [Pragia fontium]|uniref:DUF7424 family protein n=1 Tax=Pragia fontium TaxID=82985 RepID=UPI00064A485D|nr:hypothetical protein [Pragia fontium]AKJ42703.1 hypothetical protein QQ39_11925 [Pragia fontium]